MILRVACSLLCILGMWLAPVLTPALVPRPIPAQQASAQQQESRPATIEIAVTVTDAFGRPVIALGKDDFRLTDGNETQTITSFSSVELPVSYGLIVDTTGSMRKILPLVIQAARAVVKSQKPGDRAFLVRLDSATYRLALDWTEDQASLSRAIETFTEAKGQTSVIDALYSSCKYLASDVTSANGRDRKRAVVIVSDLQDTVSRYKPNEIVECLRKADVEVHPIALSEEIADRWKLGPYQNTAITLPRMLAKETGGIALFPALSERDVIPAASGILPSCRFQYRIRYCPHDAGNKHASQKPQVKLIGEPGRKKYVVVTRLLETS